MDEETRQELETLKRQLGELASCIRTLQALAEKHHKAIKALNEYVEA